MKKYRVNATMYEYGYFEVEAENELEARNLVSEGEQHFIGRDCGCDFEEITEII